MHSQCPTKNQAEMYCCKYCSKHNKNLGARTALFDVLDDMEQKDKAGKEKEKGGGFMSGVKKAMGKVGDAIKGKKGGKEEPKAEL